MDARYPPFFNLKKFTVVKGKNACSSVRLSVHSFIRPFVDPAKSPLGPKDPLGAAKAAALRSSYKEAQRRVLNF